MAGLFKKKYVENQPGQNLPVVTVPGKIVFQSNRGGSLSEIYVLENGQMRKIASDEKTTVDLPKGLPAIFGNALAGMKKPKWSPDGLQILCGSSDEENAILDANGQVLTKFKPQKSAYEVAWDPRGEGVYFTEKDKDLKGGGSFNIYYMNIETEEERRITNLPPLPGIRHILSLAISPDNQKIAFNMVDENTSIWLINTDGTDLKRLVKIASDPAWSPDGKKLVYTSEFDPTGQAKIAQYSELFVLDLDTMQTDRITNNQWEDRFPVFSPEGKQIAFKSARHNVDFVQGAELFVINIDGTGEARLTPPQRNSKYPPDSINGWATDEYPDWHA